MDPRVKLLTAFRDSIAALRRAVEAADELAPCSEQSRCRDALAALGVEYKTQPPEPPSDFDPRIGDSGAFPGGTFLPIVY